MRQLSNSKGSNYGPRRQRGVVMVLFTVAMLVILGMAGLALDGAHGMLSKTRLQSTVDAAALSAAKTLDETDDQVAATVEALAMFSTNASGAGNGEIAASYSAGQLSVSVQYSSTLHPFVPGTAPADYVRVTATNLRLPGWLIPVMGVAEMVVTASAVSGPSPTIDTACNIAPMMVCGDPLQPSNNWGYSLGEADVLKASTNSFEVGPGNFQLIRLGGGMGGSDVRDAMAGSYEECLASQTTVPTEPGNTVGPVVQGLNTRFGIYSGPMGMGSGPTDYPPDVNVTDVSGDPNPPGSVQLEYECDSDGSDNICYNGNVIVPNTSGSVITYDEFYDWSEYQAALPATEPQGTAFGRRTVAMPVGDCTNTTNGQGDVPVLGFLCYHLLQPAQQKGNESQVYGQFIPDGCPITGFPGPAPGMGPGPYIIQLYKDETEETS